MTKLQDLRIDRETVERFSQPLKNLENFCLNDLKTLEGNSRFLKATENLKEEINNFQESLRDKTSAPGQMPIMHKRALEQSCSESIRILDEWSWMIDPIIEKLRLEAREPIENPLTVEERIVANLESMEKRLQGLEARLASMEKRLQGEAITARQYLPSGTSFPPANGSGSETTRNPLLQNRCCLQ